MMRFNHLILACLLFLGPCTAYPAGVSNAVGDNIAFTGNARFGIPNGDFCMAGWVQAEATSVSASFSRLVRIESADGDFNFAITSGGIGTAFDELILDSDGDSGSNLTLTGTTSDFNGVTTPKLVAVERTGSTANIYVGTSAVATGSVGSWNGVNSGGSPAMWLFNQSALNRGFNGRMWEWAMWSGIPCTNMLASLAAGWTPRMFPNSRMWYVPMTANSNEIQAGSANTPTSITFEPNPGISIQPAD